jgi:hypothetical protein
LIQPVSYEQKKSDNNIYLGYAEAFPIKKNLKKKTIKNSQRKNASWAGKHMTLKQMLLFLLKKHCKQENNR